MDYNNTGSGPCGKKSKPSKAPPVTGMALGVKIHGLEFPNHIAYTTPMKLSDVACGGMRGAKCRFFNDATKKWNTDGAFAIGFLRIWNCCEVGSVFLLVSIQKYFYYTVQFEILHIYELFS